MAGEGKLIAIAVLGLALLGGGLFKQQRAGAAGPGGGGSGQSSGVPSTLQNVSFDEDIGLPPAPQVRPRNTATQDDPRQGVIVVESGNTPVIDQRPIFEVIPIGGGSFDLQGAQENLAALEGSSQIRIENFGAGPGFNISTTPETLAGALSTYRPAVRDQFGNIGGSNTFDPTLDPTYVISA